MVEVMQSPMKQASAAKLPRDMATGEGNTGVNGEDHAWMKMTICRLIQNKGFIGGKKTGAFQVFDWTAVFCSEPYTFGGIANSFLS